MDVSATKKAYKKWKLLDSFVYNDSSSECNSCEYGKELRDYKGNIYLGQSGEDLYKGRGTMIHASGNVYEGYWDSGLYSGKGRLISFNGRIYEGEWLKNKPEGRGKLVYENGDIYVGSMADGKRNGVGTLKYRDGSQFQGNWHSDVKMQGKLTEKNNS